MRQRLIVTLEVDSIRPAFALWLKRVNVPGVRCIGYAWAPGASDPADGVKVGDGREGAAE